MPPKAKFNKEEIIAAALEIVKSNGFEALTARSLGQTLGSSARPIFTVFNSMEEVQTAVIAAAKKVYDEYIAIALSEPSAFIGVGKAYIRFAAELPKLFQLLFMREQTAKPNLSNVLGIIDSNNDKILKSVENDYNLNTDDAKAIYEHLWIYSHGIAVLIATRVCSFTGEDVARMLLEVGGGLIRKIRTEGKL